MCHVTNRWAAIISGVDLDYVLRVMDIAAANMAKLEAVWVRAEPMIPTSPRRGSSREYDDLRRTWASVLPGLPKINDWTVTAELPDADEVGQHFVDLWEVGEPPFSLMQQNEEPGRQLAEYRFRLGQARRKAVRQRVEELASTVNRLLPRIIEGVERDSSDHIVTSDTEVVSDAVREIEKLLGDTVERQGRWSNLRRHMSFSEGHDWHDIAEWDWPSVRTDIEAAGVSDADPVPVPDLDVGKAADAHPAGGVTTGLSWQVLSDDEFERLLFDLLRGLQGYQNVTWLMNTRAPDRGRDLSLERVIPDPGGTTRTERVMVQAKHWLQKSVGPMDIQGSLAALPTWEPPVIRALIVATTGRFTADAVAVAEKHNTDGKLPFIEMWPDNHLEMLLNRRPDLLVGYRLRGDV